MGGVFLKLASDSAAAGAQSVLATGAASRNSSQIVKDFGESISCEVANARWNSVVEVLAAVEDRVPYKNQKIVKNLGKGLVGQGTHESWKTRRADPEMMRHQRSTSYVGTPFRSHASTVRCDSEAMAASSLKQTASQEDAHPRVGVPNLIGPRAYYEVLDIQVGEEGRPPSKSLKQASKTS